MFKRFLLIIVSVVVSACGSSSSDESNPDLLPQNNNPNVPRFEVPPIVNGFYLKSETVTLQNGEVFREIEYELDRGANTTSQFGVSAGGQRRLQVVYEHDEDGQIVAENVVSANGAVIQTTVSTYDGLRRLVSTNSFISDEPFMTTDYFFNDVGAPFQNVVRSTDDNVEFSTTTFQYDSERLLTSSIFKTPLLPDEIRKLYQFSDDGSQLLRVDEKDEGGVTYEYDNNGNVIREITRNSDDVTTSVSEFTYEETGMDSVVPNLLLHKLAYEFDKLF